MKILFSILTVLFVSLQFKLWVGDGSLAEVWQLSNAVESQKEENSGLRERNLALEAEVADLRTGFEAVEERARKELGMIREGETFFQVVEPEKGSR